MRALAPQLAARKSPVILNMVNPGFCYSELGHGVHLLARVMMTVMRFLLARTTEVGSRNLVYAAAVGDETHGEYLLDCKMEK